MIEFALPWPPSLNSYYRSLRSGPLAGRVLISEDGRRYCKDARENIREQIGDQRITDGRLSVVIVAKPPDRRARDLDNLLKSLLDAIHHAGVIRDDSDIDSLHIIRGDVFPGGIVKITVGQVAPE